MYQFHHRTSAGRARARAIPLPALLSIFFLHVIKSALFYVLAANLITDTFNNCCLLGETLTTNF
ncbi:hypothetical protein TH1_22445 [Thalassospira lucentensis MCCC 1A00383 = DSM 14000]|nr:hypothetical protein TH1_22445 [Thalassospira lucentensis MCCC 1A00383 = DSM 14000]